MTSLRLESTENNTAVLRLESPSDQMNFICHQFWLDLGAVCDKLMSDRPGRLILTACSRDGFVAGSDLQEIRRMSDAELDACIADGQRALRTLEDLPFMTVAAINGDCLGAGLELAMACKVRVCADEPTLRLGLPQCRLGLVPCWGGTMRLRRIVGLEESIKLAALGELIDPRSALRIGLVNELAPFDRLMSIANSIHHQAQRKDNAGNTRRIFEWADGHLRNTFQGDDLVAPMKALQIERDGVMHGEARELEEERSAFIALRHLPATRQQMQEFLSQHPA